MRNRPEVISQMLTGLFITFFSSTVFCDTGPGAEYSGEQRSKDVPLVLLSQCGRRMPDADGKCPSSQTPNEKQSIQISKHNDETKRKTKSDIPKISKYEANPLIDRPIQCNDDESAATYQADKKPLCDVSIPSDHNSRAALSKEDTILRLMRPSLIVQNNWASAVVVKGYSEAESINTVNHLKENK